MASTPESKVKAKCVKQLKELGAVYFYPVMGGYGSSGISDIIVCYDGHFIAIECKAGKNKPTPLQEKFLNDVKAAHGLGLVINEDNVGQLADMLRLWAHGVPRAQDALVAQGSRTTGFSGGEQCE